MVRSPMNRRQDEAPLTPPENKTERELYSGQRESFSLNRISFGGHHHSEIPQNDPDYYPTDAGDRSLFREGSCPPCNCDCDCTSDGLTGCLRRNRQCLFTVMILSVSTVAILLIFRSLSYDHRERYVEDSRVQTRWEFHHHHYNESDDGENGLNKDYPHKRISIPIIEDSRDPDYYVIFPHATSVLKLRQETRANILNRRRKRGATEDRNIRDMIVKEKSKYEQVLAELTDIEKTLMGYKTHFSDNPRTVFEPFSLTNPTTVSGTESSESFEGWSDETGSLKDEVTDNYDFNIIRTEISSASETPGLEISVPYDIKPSADHGEYVNSLDTTPGGVTTEYFPTGPVAEVAENALGLDGDYMQLNSKEYTDNGITESIESHQTGGFVKITTAGLREPEENTAENLGKTEFADPNSHDFEFVNTSPKAEELSTEFFNLETETFGNEAEKGEAKNIYIGSNFLDEPLPDFESGYSGKLFISEEPQVKDRTVGISLAEAKKKKFQDRKQLLLNSRVVSGATDISFPTGPDETKSVLNTDESLNTSQQLSMTPSAFAQYFFPYQMCFYANPPSRVKPSSRESSPKTFKIEAPSFFHIPNRVDDPKKQTSYHFPTQQNFLSFNINNYANQGHPSSQFPPSGGSTYFLPHSQHFVPFLSGAPQPQQQPLFCTYVQPPLLQFPTLSGASEFIQPKCDDCEDELPSSREMKFLSIKDVACMDNTVSCRDGSMCITTANWCDNKIHCKDGSDEIYCSCRERIAFSRLCDGYLDCPNGEDEIGCFGCPKSTFSCDTYDEPTACIPISKRCDGFRDCPTGKDEMDCTALFSEIGNNNSYHVSYSRGFLHRNWRGDWIPVCVEVDSNLWAGDACKEELGSFSGEPEVSFARVSNAYKGPFIVRTEDDRIIIQEHCKGHVSVYVKCPEVRCGTRIMSEDYAETRFKRYVRSSREFDRWLKRVKKDLMAKYKIDDVYWKLSPVEGGGKKEKREETGRVVGGKESEPRAWPWVVALYKNGDFHCGGVILDETWIMTAAHCVMRYGRNYYEIRSGMLRRFSYSPMEQVREISEVIIHEKYNKTIMNNDLALLRVKKPLSFNRWVRPACLPSFEGGNLWGPTPGSRCIAIGWGAVKEHGSNPDQMREVEVPILPKCRHVEDVEGNEICAGIAEGGKDTCQGDSGGPLLCRDTNSAWYVAGIVSHGEGCARPGEPGAYTRVSIFMDWITANSNDFQLPTEKPLAECPGFRCRSGSKLCISLKWVCNGLVDCLDGEDEMNCPKSIYPSARSVEDEVLTDTSQRAKEMNPLLFDEEVAEKKNGSSQTPVVRSLKKLTEITSYIVKALEVYDNHDYLNESVPSVIDGPKRDREEKGADTEKIAGGASESVNSDKQESAFSKEPNNNAERMENKESWLEQTVEEEVSAKMGEDSENRVRDYEDAKDVSESTSKETGETEYEALSKERTSDGEHENLIGYIRDYDPPNASLPDTFQCRKIIQTVKSLYQCDGITDCEDGTDETLCTCRDRLIKSRAQLVCNGVADCEDLTDEKGCHSCSTKEFNCMRSRQCLSKFKRCDSVRDCVFGEDEEDCFALAKNGKMNFGKDRKPLLRFGGTLMTKKGDVWSPYCQNDDALKMAVHGCSSLGSTGYDRYENGTDFSPDCKTLDLTCSKRLTNDLEYYRSHGGGYHWPWQAFVYSDGKKLCSAALLGRNWLMTGVHCAEHFSFHRNHVVAKLGSSGEDLDGITEFGTQVIRVDGMKRVHNSEIILLHLSKRVDVTWRVRPISIPFWFDVSSSKDVCVALGGEETIFLRSVPHHGGSFRCFTRIDDSDNCKITHRHRPWTGVVACQSPIGWYPASVFHETKGFCGFERYYYPNILERIKEIKSAAGSQVKTSSELKCDGLRCREGKCIPTEKICDGRSDCPAGEDETFDTCFKGHYERAGCKINEITCNNGACADKKSFANGIDDCGDGSDEPEPVTCYDYLKLTSPERICDGIANCLDKSDERPDNCPCSSSKFNCTLSIDACVPFDYVCDGAKDCPNGEDEAECVGYKRLESNKKEVEIIHMSYGVWHSLCSPSITEEQANSACRELGYEISSDTYRKNETQISPTLDPFTTVKLNARTSLVLRSDRAFAKTEENSYCEVLRVVCH